MEQGVSLSFIFLFFSFSFGGKRWDHVSDPGEKAAHPPGYDGDSPMPQHRAHACLSFPMRGKLMNHVGLQKGH